MCNKRTNSQCTQDLTVLTHNTDAVVTSWLKLFRFGTVPCTQWRNAPALRTHELASRQPTTHRVTSSPPAP